MTPMPAPTTIIRSHQLLLFYLPLVAVAVFISVDQVFFDGMVRQHLPATPTSVLFYGLLFGLPHIVASAFAYADKDYLAHYRRDFTVAVPLIIATAFALSFFVPTLIAFIAFTTFTLVHTIGQQAGLSRAYLKNVDPNCFAIWRWCTVGLGVSLGLSIGGTTGQGMPQIYDLLLPVSCVLLLATTVYAIQIHLRARNTRDSALLLATQCLLALSFYCVVSGYWFFAILLPQVVHDLSAYFIYIAHDRARNTDAPRNALYTAIAVRGRHVWIALPLLSIGLTLSFEFVAPSVLILTLTLFHYYIEKKAWSGGSIHRRHVQFANPTLEKP